MEAKVGVAVCSKKHQNNDRDGKIILGNIHLRHEFDVGISPSITTTLVLVLLLLYPYFASTFN